METRVMECIGESRMVRQYLVKFRRSPEPSWINEGELVMKYNYIAPIAPEVEVNVHNDHQDTDQGVTGNEIQQDKKSRRSKNQMWTNKKHQTQRLVTLKMLERRQCARTGELQTKEKQSSSISLTEFRRNQRRSLSCVKVSSRKRHLAAIKMWERRRSLGTDKEIMAKVRSFRVSGWKLQGMSDTTRPSTPERSERRRVLAADTDVREMSHSPSAQRETRGLSRQQSNSPVKLAKVVQESESTVEEESSKVYEVEKIIGAFKAGRITLFLVKWKGYGISYNTWEERSCLKGAIDSINDFVTTFGKVNAKQPKILSPEGIAWEAFTELQKAS